MSINGKQPSVSVPALAVDLDSILTSIKAALPGVVQSVIVVSAGVVDGEVSGVVLDDTEPGGGYISSQELATGCTYILLGVGNVPTPDPGVGLVTLQPA